MLSCSLEKPRGLVSLESLLRNITNNKHKRLKGAGVLL
jgi:hypothetical protein